MTKLDVLDSFLALALINQKVLNICCPSNKYQLEKVSKTTILASTHD